MGKLDYISFDLSLARGLDYYTGVIYEAVCMSGTAQVGSIGGGGRYDNLVGMFQEGGKQTPCVGVSVGIERVFTLMEARLREEQGGSIKKANVEILVASAGGNGMLQERMKITRMLWDANLSAEFTQQETPKVKYELASALDRGIPYVVIVGETEWAEDSVKVKDLAARTEETVKILDLVSVLRGDKGIVPVGCQFAFDLLKKENQGVDTQAEG
uniref:histidine--tRNA ligase n=1 Tax=Grammatophora oceanica TaxID=210454 RepID=A0A7S1UXW1_9STRA